MPIKRLLSIKLKISKEKEINNLTLLNFNRQYIKYRGNGIK